MCLGVPGKILELDPDGLRATVDFFGVRRSVRLDVVDSPVQIGDYIINHVGFAIRRIPEEEIRHTLEVFEQLLQSAPPGDLLATELRAEMDGPGEPSS